jgi:hypothetical protein
LFSLDAAETTPVETSLLNGTLVDAQIGYAVRPVTNERLNVLASYRYLYDMFGQEIDGVASTGPVQESHVADLQISYDLNREWTLGANVGIGYNFSSFADDLTDPTQDDHGLFINLIAKF